MKTTRHHSHLLSLPIALGLLATSACGGATSKSGAAPGDGGTEGAVGDGQAVTGDAASEGDAQEEAGSAVPPAIALYSCQLDAIAWTVGATIGTQQFQFTVDTGSTTLGVASTMCSGCGVSPEYTPGSTAVDQKMMGESQYGTGSWTGEIYKDTVGLPPGPSTQLPFVAIDTQSMFFEPVQCDSKNGSMEGIIGFGPSASAIPGTIGFMDQLVASQKIPDIFAMKLCDTGGSLWLGGYDPSATTAAPQYTPFDPNAFQIGYYAVNFVSIGVNGMTIPVGSAEYPDSLVDTGTSIFALAQDAYTSLTNAIGADANFTKVFGGAAFFAGNNPCAATTETKATLDAMMPALTLTLGSTSTITVQATATESYLFDAGGGEWCSAMQGFPQSENYPVGAVMGAPLLRSNVMIFDRSEMRLGFAPHTACP
jgi:hypothetical protein